MAKKNRTKAEERKRRHQTNVGIAVVMVVVTCFAIVMLVHTNTLRAENSRYEAQEENLQNQYAKEEERSTELSEEQEYVKTDEYVEQIAREKLGLVKPDEKVVRPKE